MISLFESPSYIINVFPSAVMLCPEYSHASNTVSSAKAALENSIIAARYINALFLNFIRHYAFSLAHCFVNNRAYKRKRQKFYRPEHCCFLIHLNIPLFVIDNQEQRQ